MAPRDPRIDAVLKGLRTGAAERRFFDKASDPLWIDPLREDGYFNKPPKAQGDESSRRFVAWPQAEYLARVAAQADPRSVVRAIKEVPETENIIIYPPLLQALAALPAKNAAEVAGQVERWVSIPHAVQYAAETLSALVKRLASGGSVGQAVAISRAVLRLSGSSSGREMQLDEERTVQLRPEIQALVEPWAYERWLDATVPALTDADPAMTTQLLADVLDEGVLTEFGSEARAARRDVSYVWCREVEAAAESPAYDYKAMLVPALRAAALAACSVIGAEEVVRRLRSHEWPIHSRIAMHIAEQHSADTPEVARALVLEHELFKEMEYRHEYSRLVAAAFGSLPADGQHTILSWIEAGPGEDWAPDSAERWQRDRLAPIRGSLSAEWVRRYSELVRAHGPPSGEADHGMGPVESWVGPTSSLTVAEMRQLSVADVVAHLRTWQPSQEWHSPSREGLGRTLAQDVQTRVAEYLPRAGDFGELEPTYARHLLMGLRMGFDAADGLDLGPLLQLGTRIAEDHVVTPRRRLGSVLGMDDDGDWTACRRELAHLLETIANRDHLTDQEDAILWVCVARLLMDSDPTPEDEARFGQGMGGANYSINCVRGQAVHAAAAYLAHLKRSDRMGDLAAAAMSAIARRLDGDEPSDAVRAAIGMRFQQLLACHEDWAAGIAPRVFTDDAAGRAAWSAFLRFTTVHSRAVDILWTTLERAVVSGAWQGDEDCASESLALTTSLYVGGYAAPGDLLGLTRTAWRSASVRARASALIKLGNRVSRSSGTDVAIRTAELAEALFAYEEAQAGSWVSSDKRSDLEAFGWVLATGQFPIEWTLEALRRLLTLGSLPMDPDDVVKLLAGAMLREDLQGRILDCLHSFVGLDKDNWAVYASRLSVATIIKIGRVSADETVRRRADELERRLLTSGRFNPDWLKDSASQSSDTG